MRKVVGELHVLENGKLFNNLHKSHEGPIELYDLYRDPSETLDVSQSHPQLVKKAKKYLKQQVFLQNTIFENINKKEIPIFTIISKI